MVYGSDKDSNRVGCRDIYNRSVESVLVLFSNSYSLFESILVEVSGTLFVHFILFTDYLTTNYYPNKTILQISLRREYLH